MPACRRPRSERTSRPRPERNSRRPTQQRISPDSRIAARHEDEPEELAVRGGLFANRVYRIRVDAIRAIEPRTQRIVVRMDRERPS